jgi:hypothetical protein
MMNILGKIFGSESIVNAGINAIDAMVFTDEEKSKAKLELLKAYEPFKIAQRYLALIFAGLFSVAFLASIVLALLGNPIEPVLEVVTAFSLGEIVLAVVAFYFLGGVTNGFRVKK